MMHKMKSIIKKVLWFFLGFLIFIFIEGIAYHGVKVVDPADLSAAQGLAFIGGGVFILWMLILGFTSARKNKYNWPFISGATIAYVLASKSLQPVFTVVVIMLLWYAAFRSKHKASASNIS